ncbi:hypothetical protein Cni_G05828 [Canna indica]|uniref:Uncharacterized protein n=1 Tax=Canna indica TaxID=4628 RepID=A0AAQ3Q5D8_9LILI|nr:hypothetical protein Cni_G05828 [Canna indica]
MNLLWRGHHRCRPAAVQARASGLPPTYSHSGNPPSTDNSYSVADSASPCGSDDVLLDLVRDHLVQQLEAVLDAGGRPRAGRGLLGARRRQRDIEGLLVKKTFEGAAPPPVAAECSVMNRMEQVRRGVSTYATKAALGNGGRGRGKRGVLGDAHAIKAALPKPILPQSRGSMRWSLSRVVHGDRCTGEGESDAPSNLISLSSTATSRDEIEKMNERERKKEIGRRTYPPAFSRFRNATIALPF